MRTGRPVGGGEVVAELAVEPERLQFEFAGQRRRGGSAAVAAGCQTWSSRRGVGGCADRPGGRGCRFRLACRIHRIIALRFCGVGGSAGLGRRWRRRVEDVEPGGDRGGFGQAARSGS